MTGHSINESVIIRALNDGRLTPAIMKNLLSNTQYDCLLYRLNKGYSWVKIGNARKTSWGAARYSCKTGIKRLAEYLIWAEKNAIKSR